MKNAGFTLLEIMLVMVLLGIATAVVLPTLEPGDSSARLKTDAERFAALVKTGHEESLIKGKDLGVKFTRNGYQFMERDEGKWQPLQQDRMLTEKELPEAITLDFKPGELVWQAALDAEQQDDSSALFDDEEESKKNPDLYIWSSGEITPAEVRFQSSSDARRFFSVMIRETGEVKVVNADDYDKKSGRS
ncbi:type II secretion system minor pseudopilin GspH [Endozoicomonas arenosclerae]|uniref:type II secretion system minor pseudopilin GspH n=1 Tax=Endozoicomonas arenosclerae TaxID=1633495 RepID=UPI0007865178|nr:type II secretion system minor pseudopilin GspH [Endozoicomonas arenosclerae]